MEETAKRQLRILQLTDTHIVSVPGSKMRGIDTFETLQSVMDLALQCEDPDIVVLTGDLSHDELAASYRRVAEVAERAHRPVYYLPGNHDDREVLDKAFSTFDCVKPERHATISGWQLIFLDSTLPGLVEGRLSDLELSRLERLLEGNTGEFVVLFVHHNPVNLEPQRRDPVMILNADELFALVSRFDCVRAIVCGHVHQEFEQMIGGIKFLSTPSTCFQFRPTATGVTVDEKAPGYRIIELMDDGSVSSRVVRTASVPLGLELSVGD